MQPHLHPLLGPYLDALQEAGQPPPNVKWVIQLPDGGELDGSARLKAPGKAWRYTTRDKADRTLAWLEDYIPWIPHARVIPVLELPAALP